jgi:hypothetical protein
MRCGGYPTSEVIATLVLLNVEIARPREIPLLFNVSRTDSISRLCRLRRLLKPYRE